MAKPPAGSSLLFGALADSGQIKQRKNGNYRMVLKGVDEIDWFTDRPDRAEGTWRPQKLIHKWDSLFVLAEPNAQTTFSLAGNRELATFEMFKPKSKSDKIMFNIKPLSKPGEDKVTGLLSEPIDDISLFIDAGGTTGRTSEGTLVPPVGIIGNIFTASGVADPSTSSTSDDSEIVLQYQVSKDTIKQWGSIGDQYQIPGLQYGSDTEGLIDAFKGDNCQMPMYLIPQALTDRPQVLNSLYFQNHKPLPYNCSSTP